MEMMEKLWTYMQADRKAEQINRELRSSPLRQKLEKMQTYILERQQAYKTMEQQVANHADRKDALQDVLQRAKGQLEALEQRFAQQPPQDTEQVDAMIEEIKRCQRRISEYQHELERIFADAKGFTSRAQTIRSETARARQQFMEMKDRYTEELASRKTAYQEARAAADAQAQGIPEDLMQLYSNAKKHTWPPMARLVGSQCSGCNTALPSAALRKIDAGDSYVECENCGRILIK